MVWRERDSPNSAAKIGAWLYSTASAVAPAVLLSCYQLMFTVRLYGSQLCPTFAVVGSCCQKISHTGIYHAEPRTRQLKFANFRRTFDSCWVGAKRFAAKILIFLGQYSGCFSFFLVCKDLKDFINHNDQALLNAQLLLIRMTTTWHNSDLKRYLNLLDQLSFRAMLMSICKIRFKCQHLVFLVLGLRAQLTEFQNNLINAMRGEKGLGEVQPETRVWLPQTPVSPLECSCPNATLSTLKTHHWSSLPTFFFSLHCCTHCQIHPKHKKALVNSRLADELYFEWHSTHRAGLTCITEQKNPFGYVRVHNTLTHFRHQSLHQPAKLWVITVQTLIVSLGCWLT